MRLNRLLAALTVCALAACSHKSGSGPSTKASPPPLMIDQRGMTMPLQDAVKEIRFRPYLPPGQTLAFAVIPPLGNADVPKNRGLAAEYATSGVAMMLSEWPKQSFALTFGGKDITNTPCTVVKTTTGVAWTTRSGLLMTLQPDGDVRARMVDAEARRLIGAGACR